MLRAGSLFDRYGITRAADVTGLDRIGILVALAVRPNPRSVSVSQGKGVESRHQRIPEGTRNRSAHRKP